MGLISGCGTASNLWKSSLRSEPMLIYAPLFSVLSQYLGAEKTRGCLAFDHWDVVLNKPVMHRPSCSTS